MRAGRCAFWGGVVALVVAFGAQAGISTAQTPPPSLAPMVELVTPGVVGISVSQSQSADNPLMRDPIFRQLLEDLERERQRGAGGSRSQGPAVAAPPPVRPAGSGVVVDAERGLVLTNHHVIQGATRFVVVLKDRREMEAQLVGSDAGTDLALLRVNATGLSAVALGDSDALRIGDYLVAIGNPFGLGQTVTQGIVSALGRGQSNEGYQDYIQTDAAINPGNSGGALVNLRGELVGINTAIFTVGEGRQGGNIGIGFAVPANMAKQVVAQILRYGEVRRGRIGVQVAEVNQALAAELRLPGIAGALVAEVQPGSPAERAGLRKNDVVLQLNGRAVRTGSDFRNGVALVPVGDAMQLTLSRGGQLADMRITVEAVSTAVAAAEPESAAPSVTPPPSGGSAQGGLQGAVLGASQQGVQVRRVETGSSAHGVGLRAGDTIVSVDRQAVATPAQLQEALRAPGSKVLVVVRGDSKLRLTLR